MKKEKKRICDHFVLLKNANFFQDCFYPEKVLTEFHKISHIHVRGKRKKEKNVMLKLGINTLIS